jgi:DNA-binding transcriptional regulator YdaS (Cro superfamily)
MNVKDYLLASNTTGKQLADLVGVAPTYLSQMMNGKRPWKNTYCTAIERVTNGLVKRQDLRPNDFWLVWPDLKAPRKAPAHKKKIR